MRIAGHLHHADSVPGHHANPELHARSVPISSFALSSLPTLSGAQAARESVRRSLCYHHLSLYGVLTIVDPLDDAELVLWICAPVAVGVVLFGALITFFMPFIGAKNWYRCVQALPVPTTRLAASCRWPLMSACSCASTVQCRAGQCTIGQSKPG